MNRADFEFVREEGQEDPIVSLTWKERFNVFGITRMVFGYVRDSSGRPNNLLGLLYAYTLFFFVSLWWATHPTPIRHELDLTCDGKGSTRIPKESRQARDRQKTMLDHTKEASKKLRQLIAGHTLPKVQQEQWSCAGAVVRVQLTLPPPPALPPAFYWVLVTPILSLLGAYLARHPRMRAFLVRMVLAWRGAKGEEVNFSSLLSEGQGILKANGESLRMDVDHVEVKSRAMGPRSIAEREH